MPAPTLRWAWAAFKVHHRLLLAIGLAMFGAWVVLEIIVVAGQRLGLGLWILAHVAFLVFFAGLQAGLIRVCLAIHDGRPATFAVVRDAIALGPRLLAGQIAYLAMVLAGLALLVVPGLILAARYAFYALVLVDRAETLAGSFELSARATRGRHARVLSTLALLFALNVLGAALLGVGVLVSAPLSTLVLGALYRQLDSQAVD